MEPDYQKVEFPYARAADQDAQAPTHHPVVVVGAGPVGLTAAIDIAQRGVRVVPCGAGRGLARLAARARDAHTTPAAALTATIDAALDSLGAIGQRAEPWELIAYCDVRLGQPELAIGAAEAAVRRDPDNWEYHYALALVRGAAREDPRRAAADALRLNPEQSEAQEAVKAFRTGRPAQWERRARKLPLYLG